MNPYLQIAQLLNQERANAQQSNPLIQIAQGMPTSMPVMQTRGGSAPKWWEYIAASVTPAISKALVHNAGQSQIDAKIGNIAQTLQGLRGAEDKAAFLAQSSIPEAALAFDAQKFEEEAARRAQIEQYQLQKEYDPELARQLANDTYSQQRNDKLDAYGMQQDAQRLAIERAGLALRQQETSARMAEAQQNAKLKEQEFGFRKEQFDFEKQALQQKQQEFNAGKSLAAVKMLSETNEKIRKDSQVQEYSQMGDVVAAVDGIIKNPDMDENTKRFAITSLTIRGLKPEAINDGDYNILGERRWTRKAVDVFKSLAGGVDPQYAQLGALRNALVDKFVGMTPGVERYIDTKKDVVNTYKELSSNPYYDSSKVALDVAPLLTMSRDLARTMPEDTQKQRRQLGLAPATDSRAPAPVAPVRRIVNGRVLELVQ